jgi:hypothetical protein
VPVEKVRANDYNPNKVASVELQLLYVSIKADGYTQPVVTIRDDEHDRWVIVCAELGMSVDELLRLKHVTGFSKLFENTDYRKAWETRKQVELRREYARLHPDEEVPPL